MQINSVPTVPLPSRRQIHVRSDGVIGVTYFDLRSNTSDPRTLPTEAILARSSDNGTTWSENRRHRLSISPTRRPAGGLFSATTWA